MRVLIVGGTRIVGPAAADALIAAGHDVAVAHSGAHESRALDPAAEHIHGARNELLAAGGAVERWRPDALVDTFAGGASAASAAALAACAERTGARIVAVSSVDVYRYLVEAGLGDGSGTAMLPAGAIPLREDAPLREGPYPGAAPGHDNVAMEAELHGCARAAALRPGAIYGPFATTREHTLVERAARGERRLELPDGGAQVFHRVALARVAAAIGAAVERAPDGFWACNVVDPYDSDYAGLARKVGDLLDFAWEPVDVPFATTDHPWQTRHPCLASDERLRTVLGVRADEPDPDEALAATVAWLSENAGR
ncbi:MAG TPA: hypothetical protein VMA83_10825 [Solirubrobacteraceae bacterium]|nr:hypothetical protein [Solirubrobacteraceae bacterium]